MSCALIGSLWRRAWLYWSLVNTWEWTSSRRTLIHATAARMDGHDGKPETDEDKPKRKERKVGCPCPCWFIPALHLHPVVSPGVMLWQILKQMVLSGSSPSLCHHLIHCGTSHPCEYTGLWLHILSVSTRLLCWLSTAYHRKASVWTVIQQQMKQILFYILNDITFCLRQCVHLLYCILCVCFIY